MKQIFLIPIIAVLTAYVFADDASEAKEQSEASSQIVMINWDSLNMWWPQLQAAHREQEPDADAVKKILEETVDTHAEAKIDRIVNGVFARFETMVPKFKSATFIGDRLPALGLPGFKTFHEADMDQVKVVLDRCREHKIQFLAGLRMNDRHGLARKAKFFLDNPTWRLDEFPGAMDYKHEEVRKAVLAFIKELIDRFDVDGIEFDYTRGYHVFSTSEAAKNASLLTDFTRETRKLLDEAGKKRKRERVLLGVRIPQTIDECTNLGFDVATWCKDGLVDYLCPSAFLHSDFNIRTEDFVKLTEGTDCKVYPTVHPLIARGNDDQLMAPAHYRAAATNYYAFGANGISAYNFMHHWNAMRNPAYPGSANMWPKALSYLTELRDPARLAQEDRHYLYHPLWGSDPSPSGAIQNDRILITRDSAEPAGTLRFRMAEDLTASNLSAVLEFKVTGMAQDDQLELLINETVIPYDRFTRHDDADGQTEEEGRPLPAFELFRIDLAAPPAVSGDNHLGVRLSQSAGDENLDVQELEVIVQVRPEPPSVEEQETETQK